MLLLQNSHNFKKNPLKTVNFYEFRKDEPTMKKTPLFLLLAASAALFASCGSSAAYKDGTYKAQYKDPDEHGWTEYVTVTVSGGKFTAVDFDALNEDGKRKSEDEEYKAAYTGAGYQTSPADYSKKLEDSLLSKQDPSAVDAVAGATNSSTSFKDLLKKLEPQMKKGNTSTLVVEKSK